MLLIPIVIASNSVTFYIYRDGSVVVSGSYPTGASTEIGNVLITIDIMENSFTINTDVDLKSIVPPTMVMIYEGDIEFSQRDRRGTLSIKFSSYDDRGNRVEINADPLIIELDLNNLVTVFSGEVNIKAMGMAKQGLNNLAMLNKEFVEQYMRSQNITGIEVKKLEVEVGEDTAKISLNIEVSLKDLSKKSLSAEDIEVIRNTLAKLNYPISLDLSFKFGNGTINVDATVEVMESINNVLRNIYELNSLMKQYYSTTSFNILNLVLGS